MKQDKTNKELLKQARETIIKRRKEEEENDKEVIMKKLKSCKKYIIKEERTHVNAESQCNKYN